MQKQNCKKRKKKEWGLNLIGEKLKGVETLKKKLQFKKSCKTNKQQSK
jgi:hypothetical protein